MASLLQKGYLSAARNSAAAVVGNSSSGVIEIPALGIPSVDIGDRQAGRILCWGTVLHVESEVAAIRLAIEVNLLNIAPRPRQQRIRTATAIPLNQLSRSWLLGAADPGIRQGILRLGSECVVSFDESAVLGLVPARGGSQGVPRKNLRQLCGKPLISWTIQAALGSDDIDDVVVSTDDSAIADVAMSFGARVPFMRPEELGDTRLR